MTPHATAFLLSGPRDAVDLVGGLATGLRADGLPLDRVWLSNITVHPLLAASGAVWTLERGVVARSVPFGARGSIRLSRALDDIAERLGHVRLSDHAPGADRVGLPAALWEEGYAEVLATVFRDEGRPLAFFTFATRDAWRPRDVEALEAVRPTLALAARLVARTELAEVLASTYLGPATARRVLAGSIHRGDGERIPAAIWFSDLRGFTALSETHPLDEVLRLLDDAFDVQVRCIEAEGGEVLKFMGDGLLAVFRGEPAVACAAAVRASERLADAVPVLNARREGEGAPLMRYGLALHYGEVMYGNIGAPHRLDFTVIGPAVNLAARLEGLCAALGRVALASRAFADHVPLRWESLGSHPVKGLGVIEALARPS